MAALSLSLAVSATTIPSFAAGQAHGVTGKITKASSTSVQVQAALGSVTEQVTSNTRVMKEVRGSLGDLTPGTFVRVTLAPGTSTITTVHLEGRVGAGGSPESRTRPARPGTGSNGSKTSKPKTGLHRGGQIVSVGNGQLTLRNRQGRTTAYKLDINAAVTKIVSGRLSDLAVGEAVRILVRPGSSTAVAVIIESA